MAVSGRTRSTESLLEAAEHRRRLGRLSDARTAFLALAAAAERDGDDTALVAAALGVGGIWVHEQRDVLGRAEVNVLWERAARVVAPGSIEAARLAVRRSAEAVYEGAPLDAVLAAVEDVRAFGDDPAHAEALSLLHHVQLGPRWAKSRLGLAEEIIRLSARGGDALLALVGLCWRTVDLFLLGNPSARQSLSELTERSQAGSCEALAFIADVLAAMVLVRAGRFEEAERAATDAVARGTAVGDPDAGAYYGAMLAVLRWWQGRAGELIPFVREISSSPRLGFNDHVYVGADAVLSALAGDTDGAEEALARLSVVGLGRLPESSSLLTTLALVAEAAFLLGDDQMAGSAAELIRPYAHLPVMPSLAVVCLGSAERPLGLAAATLGSLDAAVHHLDAAIVADQRLGNRPMAVLTEHTLAGVLQARGAPGDEARSEDLAARSAERASRMGMELPAHPGWLVRSHAARSGPVARRAALERCAGGWRIEVEQRVSLIPDRIGFEYLAALISQPDRDLDVVWLAAGLSTARERAEAVLDATALREYRRRAAELTATLQEEGLAVAEADRARHELGALTAALSAAVGRGGRQRAFPGSRERARTAVRKALIRAVTSITAVEPDLGRHLQATLETGVVCRYRPTASWIVTVRPPASSLPP